MTPPPPAPPDPENVSRFLPYRQTLNENSAPSILNQETGIFTAMKDVRKFKANNSENSPAHGFSIDSCNIADYYDRSPPSITRKIESPTISISPVWIPR